MYMLMYICVYMYTCMYVKLELMCHAYLCLQTCLLYWISCLFYWITWTPGWTRGLTRANADSLKIKTSTQFTVVHKYCII